MRLSCSQRDIELFREKPPSGGFFTYRVFIEKKIIANEFIFNLS